MRIYLLACMLACAPPPPPQQPGGQDPAVADAVRAMKLVDAGKHDEALALSAATYERTRGSPVDVRKLVLEAHGLTYANLGFTDEANRIAADADALGPAGAIAAQSIRSAVAYGRCDFDEATRLLLVADRAPTANRRTIMNRLALLDISDARYVRALARADAVAQLPVTDPAAEPKVLHWNREARYYALLRLGRSAEARSLFIWEDRAGSFAIMTVQARWFIAHRRHLYATIRMLIGNLLELQLFGRKDDVAAQRALLREALAVYRQDSSPCRARFPRPLEDEVPAVQLLARGAPPAAAEPSAPTPIDPLMTPIDLDEDGIPEPGDRCPDRAEVVNGVDDTDGCPDEAPGELVGREIRLHEQLPFATNAARLDLRGALTLDWLAMFLAQQPQVLVSIEGHTDDVGDDAYNLDLSQRRAQAVVDGLVSRGVARERLSAVGYGETLPKILGRDDAARTANRRVEILVQRRD